MKHLVFQTMLIVSEVGACVGDSEGRKQDYGRWKN